MKLKNIIYTSLLSFGLVFTACNDIELNPAQEDAVDIDNGIKDLNSATAAVNGMYDLLSRVDYYGREMMVIPEVASDNILVSPTNSGRFVSNYNYSIISTNGDVEGVWNNLYKNINAANTILNFADNGAISGATDAELDEIRGHAYAIRGMAHFDLVRTFAFPYSTTDASVASGADGNGGHLGVPLLNNYEQERYTSRATVAEVYAQVIADLTTAESLLPTTVYSYSSKFNVTAVKALLARVYLYKEDYTNAFNTAKEVTQDSQYSLTSNASYSSDWNGSVSSTEALLQLPAFSNDHNGFDSLGSIYVKDGDDGNGGYGDLIPTSDIKDLYSSTDVRADWFREVDGIEYNFKFPFGWTNDVPLIRISEMYLIMAEAAGNGAGSISEGQSALDAIKQRADVNASATTATGATLVQAALLERRKELAFEGHRLYDIVRNKESVIRTDLASPSTIATISYPDYRMIWPLPQSEIDANNSINENNTGY
ncbi:RagB/SusD family nutrient uptake outer membrane protein [Polaribacter sargassicola]|uniref:RagB/SusD family nutrient uptake outer membrane protein n=1 Tax=Polaribacter sargassicola TaxID=2836891 RepID=UPI001F3CE035|nr:RagB/SusD family nutrient uptake outer membrane protein [Polaribacter sp. DS7-9]MCG1035710.1 RagB/SusD family nutrient uptake outer membrane protein [Polaribacter sp. DS7-9]